MSTKFDAIDLQVYAGDTETFTFSITQASAPANLSGYTVSATIKRSAGDGTALQTITCTDGLNGNNFLSGTVVMVLTAAVTAALPELCVYQLRAANGTTDVITLARGSIALTRGV